MPKTTPPPSVPEVKCDPTMVAAGNRYLVGLTPEERTLVALAAHDYMKFPRAERFGNALSIVRTMNKGIPGDFCRDKQIEELIGQRVTAKPGIKSAELYADFTRDT